MQPKLTQKEVDLISDLMTLEESICKKARIYSKTLTDEKIAGEMRSIADKSAVRYANLLTLLS